MNESQDEEEDLTKAIVPFSPTPHAIFLRTWAYFISSDSEQEDNAHVSVDAQTRNNSRSCVVISDIDQGNLESQIPDLSLSASLTDEPAAKKCLLSLFDDTVSNTIDLAQGPAHHHQVDEQLSMNFLGREAQLTLRPPKNVVSLPVVVSNSNQNTPLTIKQVRRRPRLHNADGFKHIQLEDKPNKRRRGASQQQITTLSTSLVTAEAFSLDAPPKPTDEVLGPIPVQVLRQWGIEGNVPPSEVTGEVLLKGPGNLANE